MTQNFYFWPRQSNWYWTTLLAITIKPEKNTWALVFRQWTTGSTRLRPLRERKLTGELHDYPAPCIGQFPDCSAESSSPSTVQWSHWDSTMRLPISGDIFFIADWYIIVWIYHNLCIHLVADGHLFPVFAIMNKTALNIEYSTCLSMHISTYLCWVYNKRWNCCIRKFMCLAVVDSAKEFSKLVVPTSAVYECPLLHIIFQTWYYQCF